MSVPSKIAFNNRSSLREKKLLTKFFFLLFVIDIVKAESENTKYNRSSLRDKTLLLFSGLVPY